MADNGDSAARCERIDVYLSGGGYRAALAAIGAFFLLLDEGKWPAVRKIVSVSGGGIVNAHLALQRPAESELAAELVALFNRLTSRRMTWTLLGAAAIPFLVVAGAVTWLAWVVSGRTWLTIAVGVVVVAVLLGYFVRFWLYLLFRDLVGDARLDDLGGTDWTVEHVFSATDLSDHGSIFFLTNAIQPQVCSLRRGYLDGRDVRFTTALRATTALPPVLPPPRVRLRSTPAGRPSPVADREYLWDPKAGGSTVKAWLADGGVTGNLGVQLDSTFSPDNVALLEHAMAKTMSGSWHVRYTCPRHAPHIVWQCYACTYEMFVVDGSGLSPKPSRLVEVMLAVPVLGVPVYLLRSLQIMYESALVDDQANVGDTLVGVVRTEQLTARLARKNWPLSQSIDSRERMMVAGAFITKLELMADPKRQRGMRMTDLLIACYAARAEAATVKTGLFGLRPRIAARVVASGYLNACLNTHGPGAFDIADRGIHSLSERLGPRAGLAEWWQALTVRIREDSPDSLAVPPG